MAELETNAVDGFELDLTDEESRPDFTSMFETDLIEKPANEDTGVYDENVRHGGHLGTVRVLRRDRPPGPLAR